MTREEIASFALSLPAVTTVVQWGGSDVYKVGGKVFAVCGPDGGLSFKVSPIGFEVLTSDGPGRQARYMAKGGWVTIDHDAQDPGDVRGWLETAHAILAGKLTRRARAEFGLA